MEIYVLLSKRKFHILYFLCIASVLLSCSKTSTLKDDQPRTINLETPLETLKEEYKRYNDKFLFPPLYEEYYFLQKYNDDVVKSLKIVEQIAIQGTQIHAIFFSYSIKANINNGFCYMRNVDNKWLIHRSYYYYSKYSNTDPFQNGKGDEAEVLLTKKDKWLKGSENFFDIIE